MSKELTVSSGSIREQVLAADAELSRIREDAENKENKAQLIYKSLQKDKSKLWSSGTFAFELLLVSISTIFYFILFNVSGLPFSLIPLAVSAGAIAAFPSYVLANHVRYKIAKRSSWKANFRFNVLLDSLYELGDRDDIKLIQDGNYIGEALILAKKENPEGYKRLSYKIRKLSKMASQVGGPLNSDIQAVLAGLAGNLPTSQNGIEEADKRLEELRFKIVLTLEKQLAEEVNRKMEQEKFVAESESKSINELFDSLEQLS